MFHFQIMGCVTISRLPMVLFSVPSASPKFEQRNMMNHVGFLPGFLFIASCTTCTSRHSMLDEVKESFKLIQLRNRKKKSLFEENCFSLPERPQFW